MLGFTVICCVGLYSNVLCWALQLWAVHWVHCSLSFIETCCARLYGILVVLSWVVQYVAGPKLGCTVFWWCKVVFYSELHNCYWTLVNFSASKTIYSGDVCARPAAIQLGSEYFGGAIFGCIVFWWCQIWLYNILVVLYLVVQYFWYCVVIYTNFSCGAVQKCVLLDCRVLYYLKLHIIQHCIVLFNSCTE